MKLLQGIFFGLAMELFIPQLVAAEIYKCDGKWTNMPCQGKVEQELKAPPISKVSSGYNTTTAGPSEGAVPKASEPLAPRLDLVRKLRKLSDEYKRKDGVSLSTAEIDGFRHTCENTANPYSECLALFDQQKTRLVELNQSKEKNEIEAERNQIEADKVDAIRRH